MILLTEENDQPDQLLQNLVSNHANVNYAAALYPEKFLYMKRALLNLSFLTLTFHLISSIV